ncbi:MAG: glycosyl transferase group 1 [uncultured bacterium]|nr:MAG: glycosyl transferase group 1 [uncultured bacterium]HBD05310.1 hypothetical protein [Candidatus Uhrbacteria bacterium]
MKIAVDARCLAEPNLTGVGMYAMNLLQTLLQIDNKNEYIFFSTGLKNDLLKTRVQSAPNARVRIVKVPNKLIALSDALFCAPKIETILREHVDLVFAPNFNRLRINGKTPFVLTVHDLSFELFPEYFSRRMLTWHKLVRAKSLCEQASAIICPSESTKQDICIIYKIEPNKIHVIPHGAACANQTNSDTEKKDAIVCIGTIEPRKNIVSVIKAYERVREETEYDMPLVIIGSLGWKYGNVLRAVKHSKFRDSIIFTGYLTQEQKQNAIANAKLLLFPSFYEGFGMPLLEAQCLGAPVIASRTSSMPEAVKHSAILIDPNNVRDIARAINAVLKDNALQSALSLDGRVNAQSFSWLTTAQKTLTVFQQTARQQA